MIYYKRTNSDDLDFRTLIKELDEDLALKNGDKNDFFAQYNLIDFINHVVLAYENDIAVGCGAFKQFDEETVEIKRMYVPPPQRRKGIARKILNALELWAKNEHYKYAVLETGERMTEAINLYQSNNYEVIPNYPPYDQETTSICFSKVLL